MSDQSAFATGQNGDTMRTLTPPLLRHLCRSEIPSPKGSPESTPMTWLDGGVERLCPERTKNK
jgi:hypothetical protein